MLLFQIFNIITQMKNPSASVSVRHEPAWNLIPKNWLVGTGATANGNNHYQTSYLSTIIFNNSSS